MLVTADMKEIELEALRDGYYNQHGSHVSFSVEFSFSVLS